MVIPNYLARFWRSFDCVDEKTHVGEDPNDVGYYMLRKGAATPSAFAKTIATEETKKILCEIMPSEQWHALEETALTDHLTG